MAAMDAKDRAQKVPRRGGGAARWLTRPECSKESIWRDKEFPRATPRRPGDLRAVDQPEGTRPGRYAALQVSKWAKGVTPSPPPTSRSTYRR